MLKFSKDRQRWLQWLLEAKKRYGLTILNYTVTSNHIHLLAADDKGRDVIPNSIKLVAGRTGQEFNQRKVRKEKQRGQVFILDKIIKAWVKCGKSSNLANTLMDRPWLDP